MVKLVFIKPDGGQVEVEAPEGMTVLAAGQGAGLDMEGACEGSMACSTCHVILDQAGYARLPKPREEEEDLLDLAPGALPTSRLGCQIVVTPALDGLVLRLPKSTRNLLF